MTAGTVVLVGPMGAGKTSIGRKSARMLGVDFQDTDAAIARVQGPIPEIFRTQGEPAFRVLERAAVREALDRGGVIALGGGAILDADTRRDLGRHEVVLLSVERDVVAGRLRSSTRPLLQGEDPMARWDALARERRDLYAGVADTVIDTSRGPIGAIARRLADWARARWEASTDAGKERS